MEDGPLLQSVSMTRSSNLLSFGEGISGPTLLHNAVVCKKADTGGASSTQRMWSRGVGRISLSTVSRLRAMELITILNRCHRFRGFVYQHAHFNADNKSINVAVRPP